jgi:hypothetical protein
VSRNDVAVVLAFVVLAMLSTAIGLIHRRRSQMDGVAVRRAARLVEPDIVTPPRDPHPAGRPWWGNPWLWGGVSVASLLLGLFVWRGLLGGIFLFVPFVWISRPRAPTMDPRTNGHAKREGPV